MQGRIALMTAAAVLTTGVGMATASFAGDGFTTLSYGGVESAESVAIQRGGRIVIGGSTTAGASVFDFAIGRFTKAGDIDTSFSQDGKQLVEFGGFDTSQGLALRSDGRIIAVGGTDSPGPKGRIAVAALKKNGAPDKSFSGDGKLTTKFKQDVYAREVAIERRGRIVVAGASGSNFAIARYTKRGRLDKTFSKDGRATVNFGGFDSADSVAIQRDGKIIVGGSSCLGGGMCAANNFALARLTRKGRLDRSFGGDGRVVVNLGGSDGIDEVAIQRNGRIVAAGTRAVAGNSDFALARFKLNGKLDRSFSGNGKQTTDFGGGESANAAAIQADGRIIVVGSTDATLSVDFALARYRPNGKLDKSFSGDGRQTTNLSGGGDAALDVAIVSRKRFIVSGIVSPAQDAVVARYTRAGQLAG